MISSKKSKRKKKCKHGYIKWIAPGDRRLKCGKCGQHFVLINEILTDWSGPKDD